MSRIDEALRRASQQQAASSPALNPRADEWPAAGPAAIGADAQGAAVMPAYSSESVHAAYVEESPQPFAVEQAPAQYAAAEYAPALSAPPAYAPVVEYAREEPPAVNDASKATHAADAIGEAGHAAAALSEALDSAAREDRTATADEKRSLFANDKLVLNTEVEPVAVEQYRKLAVVLHQMQAERGTKIVMIASAIASEGKTLTASNLALTLSESFKRQVLLIDADMRRPSVHDIFHVPPGGGLGAALNAIGDEKLTLVEVSPYLTILPAGRPDPNPMSGLTSDRMRRILAEASEKFEWVVVDTPPVGILPDANILAEMADTVVLVIGAGTTPFKPIQRAVDAIGRNRIAGVVLNRVTTLQPGYSYYAHYHYAQPRDAQPAA
jgi:capsular exopolysaccharide synthesis family protein